MSSSSSFATTTNSIITYDFCDADALPAEQTSLASLNFNQFYKLCPGLHQYSNNNGTILPLGQPRCGDNSNYSFFITRPASSASNQDNEKIIIELSGGGACWDSLTCAIQSSQLTFPSYLNSLVGMSCSTSLSSLDTLCSNTIADLDFSEYNYILLPYCTQDVHLGDAFDTDIDYGVHHVGGHNLYRTLSWIFENFPNPQHIFLTGCSAGATPLPVVYDLINRHYQKRSATTTTRTDSESGNVVNEDRARNGEESRGIVTTANTIIDVIADSSVFLTPKYFLDNFISNWNLNTIMNKIDIDFNSVRMHTNFSVVILDHVLERSKSTDDVAYTFHNADQISQYYYKLMNGTSIMDLLDGGRRTLYNANNGLASTTSSDNGDRRLKENDFQSVWWNELKSSISLAGANHSNFHAYFMNGTGHCSYSLNVPLGYDGFEAWASTILEDDIPSGPNPTSPTQPPITMQPPSSVPPTSNTNSSVIIDINPTTETIVPQNSTNMSSRPMTNSAATAQLHSTFSAVMACLAFRVVMSRAR